MSSTGHGIISPIYDEVLKLKPLSVLDVGIGFGRNGVEMRNLLETQLYMKIFIEDRVLKIDGIEVFEKYRNPIWDFIYDNIYIGDISEVVDQLQEYYDLIIMTDVIEHLEKQLGQVVLKKLMDRCNLAVILSHPFDDPSNLCYREIHGNSYESHLSLWGKQDYQSLGFEFKELLSRCCYTLYNSQTRLLSFDAPELSYSPYWFPWDFHYALDKQLLACKTLGETMEIRFIGAQIQIVFMKWQYGGSVSLQIDQEPEGILNLYNNDPTFHVFCQNFFNNEPHLVKVKLHSEQQGEQAELGDVQIARILIKSSYSMNEQGKTKPKDFS